MNPATKHYYDIIEETFGEYESYYKGIGFLLEGGNGYYFFSREEPRVDAVEKLSRFGKWIDKVDFLKTFNSTFGPGFTFRKSNILDRLSCDMELKDKSGKLYPDKKTFEEITDKLLDELEKIGFIELENEQEGTYKVSSAYNYIETLIDCLNLAEGAENEISE